MTSATCLSQAHSFHSPRCLIYTDAELSLPQGRREESRLGQRVLEGIPSAVVDVSSFIIVSFAVERRVVFRRQASLLKTFSDLEGDARRRGPPGSFLLVLELFRCSLDGDAQTELRLLLEDIVST